MIAIILIQRHTIHIKLDNWNDELTLKIDDVGEAVTFLMYKDNEFIVDMAVLLYQEIYIASGRSLEFLEEDVESLTKILTTTLNQSNHS